MFKKIAQSVLNLFSSHDQANAKKVAQDQLKLKVIRKKAEAYIKLNPASGPAEFKMGDIISERFWNREQTLSPARRCERPASVNFNQLAVNKKYDAIEFEKPVVSVWTDNPAHKLSLKRLESATVKAQEYAKKNFGNNTPEIVELTEKGAIATWYLGQNKEHRVAF